MYYVPDNSGTNILSGGKAFYDTLKETTLSRNDV